MLESIVLDNCEHLIDACATLSEVLLRACPNLKIMATSREGLGLVGELTYRVPSLCLPDLDHLPPVEDLGHYEAVALFVERALFNQPYFAFTNRNASIVAGICQRLDGIPLGIELAAARVKALSVEEIDSRLNDRFKLLTGGSRTALPRQQTLRATIDWSYNLLSELERTLLVRLSVFMGGWSLDGAEAICAEGIGPHEILDLLTNLVDKSLVVAEEKEGKTRYRLPETVRQYAREKLLESGEVVDLRNRHLEWYLGFAERAEPELHGPDQLVWLENLEVEHENMRVALEWSLGSGPSLGNKESEAGLQLAGTLEWFWETRGYLTEGREWLEKALAVSSGVSSSLRARALYKVGMLVWSQGDNDQALELSEEGVALCRELGDKRDIASALIPLGFAVASQGDYERAGALLEESLSLFRETGDKWGTAFSLSVLGNGVVRRVDFKRGEALAGESLSLFRELGDKYGIAYSLNVLGLSVLFQGEYERARKLCEESLILSREIGNKGDIAWSLGNLGFVEFRQENYRRSSTLYKDSLVLYQELGRKVMIVLCLRGLAMAAGALEQPEWAARLFGAAETLREAIGALEIEIPLLTDDYDRILNNVRAELRNEAFEAVWAEGQAMTMEEAVECALN